MKRKIDEYRQASPATGSQSLNYSEVKKPRVSPESKGKGKQSDKGKAGARNGPDVEDAWPDYFHSLFKVFKAINTVLAFASSKKHFVTTFPVIQSSVEGLLKRPLEISNVAELKALLPELITFVYIPEHEIQINEGLHKAAPLRQPSPDFCVPSKHQNSPYREHADAQVLILQLTSSCNKTRNSGFQYYAPPQVTPAAMKKLVEKRNVMFREAVNELLDACPPTEDPVQLLQAAGRGFMPVDTSRLRTLHASKSVPGPADRPSIDVVISEIEAEEWYTKQIAYRKTFEMKHAQTGVLGPPLSPGAAQALVDARKISTFYTHQVTAVQAINQGKNVIVSTSTASGKSVIYQIPIMRFLEADSGATAICIYPTKALAQDQRAALENLFAAHPRLRDLKIATYDGDTPQEARAGIRETASVIFTNFDMIHASILPHEELWRRRLLVVDELHYYSGLLGSHTAQIIRRLRRICAAVGNRCVRFVSCTATISNPQIHMQRMFGISPAEIQAISEDGAPSGRKDFIIWNPPYVGSNSSNSISEATRLMRFLMKRGIRVILFCKIRKICELAMKSLIGELGNEGRHDILERVKPYRGGYSREDRRQIERDAFSGRLLGIVATNALELGVDIGVLDAVIMIGFPRSISSFRQQAGRAGRRAQDSLAVLVADFFPIDQYYVNNPTELFDKDPDDIIVDLDSKTVLEVHLQCAGYEMPLSLVDEEYFGPLMREICEESLQRDEDGWYHTHPKFLPFPSQFVSIRGADEEKYTIVHVRDAGQADSILEEVEVSRAIFEIYEGGIFLHQGLTFVVKEVSHDTNCAKVTRANVNYVTSPRDYTNVDAVQTHRIREFVTVRAYYGRVNVHVRVFGFFKIRNMEILDAVEIENLPWERETTGFWVDVPKATLNSLRISGIKPAAAIHAAEHAFLNHFALSEDVKTECKARKKEFKVTESRRKRPARLIFYDIIGKGGGVTPKAFDKAQYILEKALATIEMCACDQGCTSCVYSSTCREANQVSSKPGAIIVIRGILGLDIGPNPMPFANVDVDESEFPDTIVEADPVRVAEGVQVEKIIS